MFIFNIWLERLYTVGKMCQDIEQRELVRKYSYTQGSIMIERINSGSVTEGGNPWRDFSHILSYFLNKSALLFQFLFLGSQKILIKIEVMAPTYSMLSLIFDLDTPIFAKNVEQQKSSLEKLMSFTYVLCSCEHALIQSQIKTKSSLYSYLEGELVVIVIVIVFPCSGMPNIYLHIPLICPYHCHCSYL